MQHLLRHLEQVLKKDERLTTGDRLLKNKIIELALQTDKELLQLLLSDELIKKYFFTEVGNVLVFDKIQFQKFITNKSFLPDSFTSFENRIGLTNDSEFISGNKNIVLAWPYKDCILEGGQSKEEAKRNEIFWNETLAPREIDRLLHPKIFTHFKKYNSAGCEVPKEILPGDNWIIKGNNLLVMYSLLPVFAGKIKLIYIDPPYNTGSDGFLYNDSFNHSTWLTFMKNRLEVAWKLLSDNGCIFIQTDDTEHAYLKVLCDELFGRENFKENIVLKSSTESGVNAINVKRGERLFKVKETILFYSKSPSFRFTPFYTKAPFNTNYKYEVLKEKKGYTITDLNKQFVEKLLAGRKKKDLSSYEMMSAGQQFIDHALSHPENIYSLEKNIKKAGEKFKKFAEANKPKGIVEEFTNASGEVVLIYDGGMLVPLRERIIKENGKNYFGVLASDLWVDIGTTPSNEGGISFSNGKKPEKLLKRIIGMTTKENDIVLDYHLGSGTTAAVAHKLNRQYIGIEQMDYGENDSVVRLQNVIQGDATGISKTVKWKGGGSFLYAEMAKANEHFVEEILVLTQTKQALALMNKIMATGFVSYDIDTIAVKEFSNEFKDLSLEVQKKCLMRLLDLNFLYIPFTEIDDKNYAVNEAEKKLNKMLYSLKIK